MKSKSRQRHHKNETLAIVGLILNILIWPGLGTIVGGQTKKGLIQGFLFLISIPLMFVLVGIPLAVGVWVWAVVSSVQQIREA
jgi:TM2 domain-containing membrane protein YozV